MPPLGTMQQTSASTCCAASGRLAPSQKRRVVPQISYKAAWQAIETLGNLTGTPLVEKAVGGSGGVGGAQLTPAGHRVLRAFDLLVAARHAVLAQLDDEDGGSVRRR